jgi:transposase
LARRIDEGQPMSRFVEGVDRSQSVLFPERLEDYVGEDNPVRVVDAFVEHLDLTTLGFDRAIAQATGRPGYHPATLLKIYLYGYLNRVQSSRRLEREAQRNVELLWLTGQLAPDFKTIADFRRDNGAAIRKVCREFVLLCRRLGLFAQALVAIDGSKFKAVNTRDKNYTRAKVQRRIEQIEESVARYLSELDTADRRGDAEVNEAHTRHLEDKIAKLHSEMQRMQTLAKEVEAAPDHQISLTDPDARSMATSGKGTGMVGYNVQTAVDSKHHLIVDHQVTNVGHDRNQLATMATRAKDIMQVEHLEVVADRGYFSSPEIVACETSGITPYVQQPCQRAVRQTGLRLPARGRRVPLSRWAVLDLALPLHRGRAGDGLLLEFSLQGLSAQGTVHVRAEPPRQALGPRRRSGRDAATARS